MAKLTVIEANDALTHVALHGRLDISGVGEVELHLTAQTVARRKPAIIDLSAVELLASIGIGMLVKIARSLHSHGVMLVVVATGISKDNLERLKVNEIFPIVSTSDEALRILVID